jgi:hypothetical protein
MLGPRSIRFESAQRTIAETGDMSDFIQEVDEEYRRDRVIALLKRYQGLIALIIVGIIVGAGAYRYWADSRVAAAEKVNDQLIAADALAQAGKASEAEKAYAAIAGGNSAGYAIIARMRAAQVLATQDPEAGAKSFDDVANDDRAPTSIRDAARLRGALLRIDLIDPAAFEQRYGRFGEAGSSFRGAFNELLALAAFKRQDFEAAGRYLDQILFDPNVAPALRGRAQALRELVLAGPAQTMTKQPAPASVAPVAPPAPASPAPTPSAPTTPKPATPPSPVPH